MTEEIKAKISEMRGLLDQAAKLIDYYSGGHGDEWLEDYKRLVKEME